MNKKLLLIIALSLVLSIAVLSFVACGNGSDILPDNSGNGGEENLGNNGDNTNNDNPETYEIKLFINNKDTITLQKNGDEGNEVYVATITLNVGDIVKLVDTKDHQFTNYESFEQFSGMVKIAGEYTFTVKIYQDSDIVKVVLSEVIPEHKCSNMCKTCGKCTDASCKEKACADKCTGHSTPIPVDTKTTVYYSNSEHWTNVYAYLWNSKTNSPKVKWPGERLTSTGTSEYGEKQYSITADYTLYDRIIFNDGNGKQTKDLVFSFGASGYYGVDGAFTMNKDNYGKVEYFTLRDDKNLSYINSKTKKFSVYTPSNYDPNKKYAVLYMFDSQNLYIGADGAENSHDSYGSWAVDVAVNNLVANNRDGFIIVAIDNTDGHRDAELTMSQSFGNLTNLADTNDFYNGKLDELGNFIKETLMPWVKTHYSVYGTREKTGIAGSSSGGLAAYYLGLRDKDLYGYIGAFSPANGLFRTADWNKFYSKQDYSTIRPQIYVYCGEGDNGLEDMLLPATKEIKNLTKYGYSSSEIFENYVHGGTHSENYWRIAFLEFVSKFSDFCD